MSKEVLLLVDVLAKEKNLDKEIVFECLEKALSVATKKNFENEDPELEIIINRQSGKYRTIRKWNVVSDIDFYDDDKELSLTDASMKYGPCAIGDVIEEELENVDLGRVSAQTARNIIMQRIKDAEREQVLHEYLSRNQGIVSGRLKKIERGNLILDCGKVSAIIPRNNLIPKEVFQIGQLVKAYLDKKNLIIKSGRFVLSRASNDFLKKLFELNVPEIASGRVEIHHIARDPGIRAKISVSTIDSRIDAKGACIGFKNQRLDSVMTELANEKIDIIDYNSDIAKYAINALAPAEIESIVVDEEKRVINVIVADDKLGLAIGPDGINVRLASKLVGYGINIYGATEASSNEVKTRESLMHLFNEALDVDDDISEVLIDNGFTSLDEVAYVDIQELIELPDFDEDIASELQLRAKNKILSKTLQYKDKMTTLSSQLNDIVKFSNDVLLILVEAKILDIKDFADLSGDELSELISIDLETANTLIIKARELVGYFDN